MSHDIGKDGGSTRHGEVRAVGLGLATCFASRRRPLLVQAFQAICIFACFPGTKNPAINIDLSSGQPASTGFCVISYRQQMWGSGLRLLDAKPLPLFWLGGQWGCMNGEMPVAKPGVEFWIV